MLKMQSAKESPSAAKSTYLIDNHATKVKELLDWISAVKTIALCLFIAILVNFVLMYGLIRYPCSPTASQYVPFRNQPNVI